MDATRADIEFTGEVCAIAVAEGANVINMPDTVGYTTPEEYAAYFRRLYELVPGLDRVEVSVHCHDDLGLAVANSYAGWSPAHARWSAPSTASANGPATAPSRRS